MLTGRKCWYGLFVGYGDGVGSWASSIGTVLGAEIRRGVSGWFGKNKR